jgi:cell division control protein 24
MQAGIAFPIGLHAHTSHPPTASSLHSRMTSTSTQGPPALMSHQSFQSQYSSYSHNSARDTQGTNATSTSTLFGQAPPVFPTLATPVNGGPVEASDNVLNKRADKDTSLFQRCMTLALRLRAIPGFERWLIEEEDRADDDDGPVDPVTLLWRTFRRGYPLMDLYNALGSQNQLVIPNAKADEKSQKKHEKMATYKFIQACVGELGISQESCFILTDLYGDDTTGFVKVGRCSLAHSSVHAN